MVQQHLAQPVAATGDRRGTPSGAQERAESDGFGDRSGTAGEVGGRADEGAVVRREEGVAAHGGEGGGQVGGLEEMGEDVEVGRVGVEGFEGRGEHVGQAHYVRGGGGGQEEGGEDWENGAAQRHGGWLVGAGAGSAGRGD